MRSEEMDERRRAQEGAYNLEHWGAWFMALTALVLGAIGLLRGFGIIETGEGVQVFGQQVGVDEEAGGRFFYDGIVWLLPAIAAGLLSLALHRNEHHRSMSVRTREAPEEGLWRFEHFSAWVVALGAIALGVIALLVGFDVFNGGNDQLDGILWGMGAVGLSILANTLHGVRHHQAEMDEDYIVTLVERRVSAPRATGTVGTEPAAERRQPPR